MKWQSNMVKAGNEAEDIETMVRGAEKEAQR